MPRQQANFVKASGHVSMTGPADLPRPVAQPANTLLSSSDGWVIACKLGHEGAGFQPL